MRSSLDNIIKMIENYFKDEVWQSSPPLKEHDFQLIILTFKIINLRDTVERINDINATINELLMYMIVTFKIPSLKEDHNIIWLQDSKVTRKLIIKVYKELSKLLK